MPKYPSQANDSQSNSNILGIGKGLNREVTEIEATVLKIKTDQPLLQKDARAIRGFFGNIYKNRQEFHGHNGNAFVYKHPLIQYKILDGLAYIVGLKEGAYLLKSLPSFDALEIYYQSHPVRSQAKETAFLGFGRIDETIFYHFVTPWVGLNESNYETFIKCKRKKEDYQFLLEKILIGNILSLSKSLGYVVNNRITMNAQLIENEIVETKSGLKLTTFSGLFETNFLIPDLWGIGKFSSRGYGVIRRHYGD